MNSEEIIKLLKAKKDPVFLKKMAHFGIDVSTALGIKIPELRNIAKLVGKNHALAIQLWELNIHEARIISALIADAEKITENLMEKWVLDFNSWDLCDLTCSNLFDKTKYVVTKAVEWSKRKEEFVKRAGFVLMATYSVHEKTAENIIFENFLPIIIREAYDERNFVKKAVNWALRQIGKRNLYLNKRAIETANHILNFQNKSAKWIASNALHELKNEKIQNRLKLKSQTK